MIKLPPRYKELHFSKFQNIKSRITFLIIFQCFFYKRLLRTALDSLICLSKHVLFRNWKRKGISWRSLKKKAFKSMFSKQKNMFLKWLFLEYFFDVFSHKSAHYWEFSDVQICRYRTCQRFIGTHQVQITIMGFIFYFF